MRNSSVAPDISGFRLYSSSGSVTHTIEHIRFSPSRGHALSPCFAAIPGRKTAHAFGSIALIGSAEIAFIALDRLFVVVLGTKSQGIVGPDSDSRDMFSATTGTRALISHVGYGQRRLRKSIENVAAFTRWNPIALRADSLPPDFFNQPLRLPLGGHLRQPTLRSYVNISFPTFVAASASPKEQGAPCRMREIRVRAIPAKAETDAAPKMTEKQRIRAFLLFEEKQKGSGYPTEQDLQSSLVAARFPGVEPTPVLISLAANTRETTKFSKCLVNRSPYGSPACRRSCPRSLWVTSEPRDLVANSNSGARNDCNNRK